MLAFALWSHKILRWLVPYALAVAFFANVALLDRPLFVAVFVVQLLFYLAAAVGWVRQMRGKSPGLFGIPYMFVVLNVALSVGYVNFALGKYRVQWDRTSRVGQM